MNKFTVKFHSHEVEVEAGDKDEAEKKAEEWLKTHLTDHEGVQHVACVEEVWSRP